MALVLGTAQLGLDYGIANKTGQPSEQRVHDIIKTAWDCGIREFDTAQAYGNSEQVLGLALKKLGLSHKVKIITKLNPALNYLDKDLMDNALEKSLDFLNVSKISCLMLHREEMLDFWTKGLADILKNFTFSGRVEKIGVSVYTPEKALEALNIEEIDVIQVPANILDRRFEKAGVFKIAIQKNKQIFIRSIFLQGLILMDQAQLSDDMEFAQKTLEQLDGLVKEFSIDRNHLALGYVKNKYPEAKIIFGAETPIQIKENFDTWQESISIDLVNRIESIFRNVDEKILNPVLWSAKA